MFHLRKARATAQLGALAFLLQGCNLNGNTPKASIDDNSVTEQKMTDNSISTRAIKPLAVTTAKIADSAVTAAKLDSTMTLSVANATIATAFTVGSALTVNATTFTVGAAVTSSIFSNTVTVNKSAAATLGIQNGIYVASTAAPGAASTATTYGGYFYVPHTTASSTSGSEMGATGYAYNNNSGTVAQSVGVQGVSENASTGVITESDGVLAISQTSNSASMVASRGLYAQVNNTSSGPVTSAYGVDSFINNTGTAIITTAYALRGRLNNAATVTTYHGLHLDDPGTGIAAGQYNLYSAGTVYNYIGGRLGIANMTPAYPLDVTGDINTTTCLRIAGAQTTGVCASDRRLKSNVRDYSPGLSELTRLQPKVYELNGLAGLEKGKEEVGFIAQDVEKVMPSLVVTRNVKMHEGDKEDTEIKAVNYTRFIYIVFNSVKELYAKWDTDHQRLAQLDKKIEIENLALRSENQRLKDRLDKIEFALAHAAPDQAPKKNSRKLATQ